MVKVSLHSESEVIHHFLNIRTRFKEKVPSLKGRCRKIKPLTFKILYNLLKIEHLTNSTVS